METENQTAPAGASIVERRRYPRRRINLEAQCRSLKRDGAAEPVRRTALNLGTRGVCLMGALLEKGEILMLTLLLPPAVRRGNLSETEPCPAGECQPVTVLSRVLWSQPFEEQHRCGIIFLDLERDQRVRLKSFLIDLKLDQLGSPWYV